MAAANSAKFSLRRRSRASSRTFSSVFPIWYSPTIFLGPIVRALKRRFGTAGALTFAAAYGASFALVVAASAYRYWVVRNVRTTFASSLPKEVA